MKDLGRIVANSPDGLKNNPIFKELVNEITKNKEKTTRINFCFLWKSILVSKLNLTNFLSQYKLK